MNKNDIVMRKNKNMTQLFYFIYISRVESQLSMLRDFMYSIFLGKFKAYA